MENTSEAKKTDQKHQIHHGAANKTQETPQRVLRIHLDLKLAHIDKSLIAYKAFYFLFYASLGSVFPFLPSYFKQIGFSSRQRAALFSVRSFVQLIFSPLCGILGDRFVSKKMAVQFTTFAWLIITISLAFIEPTNQVCQLVSHNHTAAKVVNTTKLKTGFFRRSIVSLTVHGEPSFQNSDYSKTENLLTTVKKSVGDSQISEFGSTSGFQAEETSGGSASVKFSIKHPTPTFSIPVKVPSHEELNYTAKNILRDDVSQLHDIFVSALTLLAIAEFLAVPAFLLIDASLLCKQTQENRLYYGQQRAFGSAGYIALFITVGPLLHRSLKPVCGETYADFVICFCFFCVCTIMTLIAGTKFEFPYKRPGSNTFERLKSIFYNLHYGTFFLAAGFMGLVHAALCQTFNWQLSESKLGLGLVGVINFLQLLGEPVGFLVSGAILKKIGTVNTIFGVLIALMLNLVCCSLISSPWYVIPFGFLEEVIYGLSWVACVTYMASSAPVDCHGTVQGILRAIYHGLGTACGTIIGGCLLTIVGPAAALRAWAVVSVLVLMAFTYGLRDLNFSDSNYYVLLMGIFSETKDTTHIGPRFDGETEVTPNPRRGEKSGKSTPRQEKKKLTAEFKRSTESEVENIEDSEDDIEPGEKKFNFFGL